MSTVAVDGIGLLVTNTEAGELTDAHVVIDGDRVLTVGIGPGATGRRRIDAGGRCVHPRVRRQPHPPGVRRRPGGRVRGPDGRRAVRGGRDQRHHRRDPRQASDAELAELARVRLDEARRAGITTVEIKSGYGATVEDEARLLRIAGDLSPETTFLGAHVVPAGVRGPSRRVRRRWSAATCSPRARRTPGGSTPSASAGRSTPTSVERCWRRDGRPGSGCASTPTSSDPGPACSSPSSSGCASADHCTYLSAADVDALAGGKTVATFLPATDFSTRQPYPDARRVIDAGATVALATNCNPGSSYTTSMSFVIALAVRDLRMTATEALTAATLGGARALRRDDIGWLGAGSRADLVILDAPSYTHLVYRPGVPLIHRAIVGGL